MDIYTYMCKYSFDVFTNTFCVDLYDSVHEDIVFMITSHVFVCDVAP